MMPDKDTTLTTKWNTPRGMLNSRIDDVDDYVFIGKKADGSNIVLSNGDEQFAQKLLLGHTSKESASFGG